VTISTDPPQQVPAVPPVPSGRTSNSRIPVLHLLHLHLLRQLRRLPVQAALPDRGRRDGAHRSLPLGVGILAAVAAGGLAALAARSIVLLFMMPPLVLLARARIAESRRRAEEASQRAAVADLCTALRAELEAGRLPEQAFAEAIWCRPQLRDLADRRSGAGRRADAGPAAADGESADGEPESLREALRRAASVPGREELAALAACWAAAERHGIAFAEAVRGIEQGLRERNAGGRELAAELAGVRATAGLLAVLPLLGLALGSALGGDPLDLLLHNQAGELCLATGAGLSMVGIWWIGRLVGSVGQTPPRRSRSRSRSGAGPRPEPGPVAALAPERWVEPAAAADHAFADHALAEHALTGGGS
jgi:tight adherence protein B